MQELSLATNVQMPSKNLFYSNPNSHEDRGSAPLISGLHKLQPSIVCVTEDGSESEQKRVLNKQQMTHSSG